ncbi:Hemocyanin C chain-like 6, partial [Homarus americanus]
VTNLSHQPSYVKKQLETWNPRKHVDPAAIIALTVNHLMDELEHHHLLRQHHSFSLFNERRMVWPIFVTRRNEKPDRDAAIAHGYIINADGSHTDIDSDHGIDVLGDIIESSTYSTNVAYYGALPTRLYRILRSAYGECRKVSVKNHVSASTTSLSPSTFTPSRTRRQGYRSYLSSTKSMMKTTLLNLVDEDAGSHLAQTPAFWTEGNNVIKRKSSESLVAIPDRVSFLQLILTLMRL